MSWLKKLMGAGRPERIEPPIAGSDNWDFYSLRVNDEPASIFLDMGIAEAAPIAVYGHRACLRLGMRHPRADGLSSTEEFEALSALEDAVTNQVVEACPGLYVGRNTSGGKRDFYFYVADQRLFEPAAKAAMHGFADYEFELHLKPDPEWDGYFNFLYPSPDQRRQMADTAVLAQLDRHGDRSDQPRQIDHFASFQDDSARAAFAAIIMAKGFSIQTGPVESDEVEARLEFSHVGAPDAIHEVSRELSELAAECSGEYGGWGCQVLS